MGGIERRNSKGDNTVKGLRLTLFLITASTASSVSKVTNPNPLDLFVDLSTMIATSWRVVAMVSGSCISHKQKRVWD